MKKNRIELTSEQRIELEVFSTTGVHDVRLVNRAKVILLSDTSAGRMPLKQEELARKLDLSEPSVCKIKRDFRTSSGSIAHFRNPSISTLRYMLVVLTD